MFSLLQLSLLKDSTVERNKWLCQCFIASLHYRRAALGYVNSAPRLSSLDVCYTPTIEPLTSGYGWIFLKLVCFSTYFARIVMLQYFSFYYLLFPLGWIKYIALWAAGALQISIIIIIVAVAVLFVHPSYLSVGFSLSAYLSVVVVFVCCHSHLFSGSVFLSSISMKTRTWESSSWDIHNDSVLKIQILLSN